MLLIEAWTAVVLAAAPRVPPRLDPLAATPPPATGEELYRAACAACHGHDGRGAPTALIALQQPLPDFTDCDFARREPDIDWVAVTWEGGPARGFSELMPAFRDALTPGQARWVVRHLRTLCRDRRWPRGELNLPLPLVTEKAFPDDEALLRTQVSVEGEGEVLNELVYEQRFGATNQFGVALPFGFREREADGEWVGRVGDIAVAVKSVLLASLETGTILALTAEVVLPIGDEDDGFGTETAFIEPFLTMTQIVPAVGFVHLQAGLGFPVNPDVAETEGFWRVVLGRTFTQGRFGRAWTPMIELLGANEVVSGVAGLGVTEPGPSSTPRWDLVPELEVTLNRRQSIRANVGVRVPLDDRGDRPVQILAYVLWDWFDGGLLEGW